MHLRMPLVFWVMLGVLAIAAALSLAPSRTIDWSPRADSKFSAGTAAFAELLRREGYSVAIDRRTKPILNEGDLVIQFDGNLIESAPANSEEPTDDLTGIPQRDDAFDHIAKFVQKGGRCLVLWFDLNLESAIRKALNNPVKISSAYGRPATKRVSVVQDAYDVVEEDLEPQDVLTIWKTPQSPFAQLSRDKLGVYCVAYDAIGVVNALISTNDNADFFLGLVKTIAPKSKRVVFAQATLGDVDDPSLLQSLGPWAQAIQWQVIALFVLLVVFYGKRFGLPERQYVQERGVRDLVEAFNWSMRRGGRYGLALRLLRENVEERIRSRLGVTALSDQSAWMREVPPELQSAIQSAQLLESQKKPNRETVFAVAVKLIEESDRWLLHKRKN